MKERHGKRYTALYTTWQNMKSRCNCSSRRDYAFYGAKGIHVCPEWNEKFSAFEKWALSSGYEAGLTIERIDAHAGYFPDNCTWVPKAMQGKNKTNTAMLDIKGVIKPVWEWAEIYNIPQKRLSARLALGWSGEEAVSTPKNGKYERTPEAHLYASVGEEQVDLHTYCEIHHLEYTSVYKRINRGWSFERATTMPIVRRRRHG